jgi:hypothetical protein
MQNLDRLACLTGSLAKYVTWHNSKTVPPRAWYSSERSSSLASAIFCRLLPRHRPSEYATNSGRTWCSLVRTNRPVEAQHSFVHACASDSTKGKPLEGLCCCQSGDTRYLARWCLCLCIAVYCRGYQAAYPAASILLIRTVLSDITIKTFAAVQAQLQPACDFLLSSFPPGHPLLEGGALLHVFSHGGCNTALRLSRSLRGNVPNAPFSIPLTVSPA